MLQIAYNNINAYVSGPDEEISELINLLSCAKKGARYYRDESWSKRRTFLNSRWNSFPTGLLEYACGKLKKAKIQYELIDKRPVEGDDPVGFEVPKLWDNKSHGYLELRDYQVAAMEAFIKSERGIIKLPTRSGKTVIAIGLTQIINTSTLFVVHNKSLLWQAYREFGERLRMGIGMIGDGEWTPSQVTIGMIQSLKDIKKNRKFLDEVGFVVFDECHRASDSYQKISRVMPNAHWRLGLSATPLMGDLESKLQSLSITGPIIYEVKMETLVDEEHIAKPIVRFLEAPFEEWIEDDWDIIYDRGIVNNEERNMMIAIIALKQLKQGKSSLILIEKLDHGERILELLKDKATVRYVHGEHDSDLRAEALTDLQTGEVDILIASRIFNEGINIELLESVIVAGGWKSATLVYQRYGRGITKAPGKVTTDIFDFIDNCSTILYNHSMERLNIVLKNRAFEVYEVKLEDI
jgi:superfamily II DNA or RNA helicase